MIAVPVKSENASEIGPTPAYKNIKTLIKAIGKPKEKRLREGADLVIIPMEHCINNNQPKIGKLIRSAR